MTQDKARVSVKYNEQYSSPHKHFCKCGRRIYGLRDKCAACRLKAKIKVRKEKRIFSEGLLEKMTKRMRSLGLAREFN